MSGRVRNDRRRPTQVGPRLGQKVCKPRDSGSGADDIKKVTVLARCAI
jgi:hypothetical protein